MKVAMKAWLAGLPKKVAEHLLVRGLGALVIVAAVALYFFVRDAKSVSVSPVVLVVGGALVLLLLVACVGLWARSLRYGLYHQLHVAYTSVLHQALETLQKQAAHDRRDVNVDEVIEKGILQPFRDLLVAVVGSGDVRLSILVLHERHWKMALQAGHTLDSQRDYDLQYEKSFSRFAFESRKIEYSNDLATDPRFDRHPEARPGREYESIVSLPIRAEGKAVAVFNVIATRKDAFQPGDFFYIGLTSSIIDIAWALREESDGSDRTQP